MAARLVIEWTRATLRVAMAEGEGPKAKVRSILGQPLGPSGEMASVLRALLGKRLPSAAQVIAVVPREQVITRVVKFPSTKSSELTQMVALYSKAQLPYPGEQAVFDFHVISQQEGFSTVAIVACQREVVDRQLTTLRDAGCSDIFLTVSSWGVLGWYQKTQKAGDGKEPALIVNVDDHRTDLVLIADGRIVSSRSVGQGAQDWEGLEDSAELLAQEIERSRSALRRELPGTDMRSCVLTGLGTLGPWSQSLAARLGLPVTAVDARQPFPEWTMPLSSAISPVVVGGLACSELRSVLNLSPAELRAHAQHRQQVRELVTVSGLLLGVFALGAGLLSLQMSRQRQVAGQLEQLMRQVEPSAKRAQEQHRSADLVRSVLADRKQLAAMLSSVFRVTPPSLALEAVNFERPRREFVLRGSAGSTQDVLEYIKLLERVDGVEDVHLKFSTRRDTPAGERTDFELSLKQRGPS